MIEPISQYKVEVAPVFAELIRRLKWVERIDEMVSVKPEDCRVSVGMRVKALLLNILTDRKALYRVQRFYERQDIELLLGPGISAEALNDDALGRALDALARTGVDRVFTELALLALDHCEIPLEHLHFDTTSISVYGAYEDAHELGITYGYSKDHRPDLKQFIFGLGTCRGLPVFGSIEDGNLSDKTWNAKTIAKVVEMYGTEKLKNAVYIADSAAVTPETLAGFQTHQVRFLSKLPNTYKLCGQVVRAAIEKEQGWVEVGALSDRSGAATYRVQSFHRELGGVKYRFIAVQSSSLDARKEKTLRKRLEQERSIWQTDARNEGKIAYACEADAKRGLETWCKNHRGYHRIAARTEAVEVRQKRPTRGRPRKDAPPAPVVTEYHNVIEILPPDEAQLEAARREMSTFVLITNLRDEQRCSNAELLRMYKEQHEVEGRFRFLKSPYLVGPIYLHNDTRVKAFACLMLLALVLYSVFEYRIRERMAKETEPLILPGNRKSFRPTGISVIDMFEGICTMDIEIHGERHRITNTYIEPQLERVLSFLDMDLSIFGFAKKSA
ncbi:MAG: IS1634 family transposase [Alicyclobacillus macrosporangiidus]|uniref:IS1634 family transposase n=1 Tax=Alicyclobacillus macrosporangiidus TaxID=392015 RepID=UPI0026EAFA30|nr:IS1634 family transposase [Alicyclobacillus macrosporangiidus]MCL6600472.1 IS1634 family transposase [Alicyclobacillus macrosporangiidus]